MSKKCGEECEVWTRCVGYHRPIKLMNKGKRAEFNDRKPFKLKHPDTCCCVQCLHPKKEYTNED